ncbi:hypothetical protein OG21DRAFT_1485773 [Imleria badia]|nr:hypothetical protein OG21DRAFT_1485773 [Imleria badia]
MPQYVINKHHGYSHILNIWTYGHTTYSSSLLAMNTPSAHPHSSAANPPSDEIFHLSLFFILDHHTISPFTTQYSFPTNLLRWPSGVSITYRMSQSQSLDKEGEALAQHDELDNIGYIVPSPRSSREAYLLLETAQADRHILLARNSLAHHIIHRNMLVLQYNWMVLERAQDNLRAADHFIGHVRLLIRKSGQTTAFKYVMQEGHSSLSSGRLSN